MDGALTGDNDTMETKIKWQWALNGHDVGGYSGIILDENGSVIAHMQTTQGGNKLQPILEHIVSIHNQSLED